MHTDQSRRVAEAVTHERPHDVYARRGRLPEEVAVRAAVRHAVIEEGRPRPSGPGGPGYMTVVVDGQAQRVPVEELTVAGSSYTMAEAAADAAGDVVTRIVMGDQLPKGGSTRDAREAILVTREVLSELEERIRAGLDAADPRGARFGSPTIERDGYELRGDGGSPPRIPPERQGWRARLAHVELLLRNHATTLIEAGVDPNGEACTGWRRACAAVRSMIDGDEPEAGAFVRSEGDLAEALAGKTWTCHAPHRGGALDRCGALNAISSPCCGACGAAKP